MSENDAPLTPEELLRHRGFVRGLARSLVRDPNVADDLEQETLAAALAAPAPRAGAVRAWLARVLRNAAARAARTEGRRRRREGAVAVPEGSSGGDPIGDLRWQQRIVRAVLGLPEPFRTAVVLRYWEDLSPTRIADRLSVPPATVRSRVHRGLALLRSALDRETEGDRSAWRSALLALAGLPGKGAAPAGAPLAGGLLLMKKLALAAGILLVLGLLGFELLAPTGGGAGPAPAPSRDPASTMPAGAVAAGAAANAPRGPVAGSAIVSGTVRRGARGVAARVEVRRLAGPTPEVDRLPSSTDLRRATAGEPIVGEADERGRFAIPGLPPGLYRVTADAGGGAGAMAVVAIPLDGVRVDLELALPDGPASLTGRVTWADGGGFGGLVVLSRDSRFADRDGVVVATGADGRFRVAAIAPGEWHAWIVKPGAFTLRLGRCSIEGATNVEWSAGERVALAGRVVAPADGTPVAGATVRTGTRTATTDGVGRFVLEGGKRPDEIHVEAIGFASLDTRVPADEPEPAFRLAPGLPLGGRVVRAGTDEPAAGATVRVEGENATATAGPDGRFELRDLSPGEVALRVDGGGWISPELARMDGAFDPLRFPVPADGEIVLGAVRAGAAAGRLTDGAGAGIPGTLVRAFDEAAKPGPRGGWRRDRLAAVTDAEGRFRIDGLVPGVVHHVEAPAVSAVSGLIRARPGETVVADLAAAATRSLRVTVRDEATGEPAAGAEVRPNLPPTFPSPRAWTGADGTALFSRVPTTRFDVSIRVGGRFVPPPPVEAGTADAEVVVPVRAGLVLAGRILFPDGTPLTHGSVRAEGGKRRSVLIDGEGRFRMEGLPPGEYHLTLLLTFASLGIPHELGTFPAGREDLEFRVEPGIAPARVPVTVRVLDPDGEPVPRVRVESRLIGDSTSRGDRAAATAGEVDFELEPGWKTMSFAAFDARDVDGTPLPLGLGVVGPLPAGAGTVTIRMPPESVVTGRVVGPAGAGIRGIRVRGAPVDASFVEPFRLDTAWTDGEGRFRIGRLGPGRYEVIVSPPPGYRDPGRVPVPENGGPVVVALARGVSATVRFRDEAGRPVAGVLVQAQIRWSFTASARTDQEGRAVFRGLEAEQVYRLQVPAGPGDRYAPFVVPGWTPRDSEFVLAAPRVLAGRVFGPDGATAAGASVEWKLESPLGWHGRVETDAAGRFRAEGLPPGRYTLRARPAGAAKEEALAGPAVTTEAGDESVRLGVAPAATMRVRLEGGGGDPSALQVRVRREGEKARAVGVGSDGEIVLRGLVPGARYDVLVRDGETARVAYAPAVLAEDGGEVALRPGPGREVRGRLILPEEAGFPSVQFRAAGLGIDWHEKVAPDGSFVVRGVPDLGDEPFEIRAWAWSGAESLSDSAPVRPGGSVTLRPRARER